MKSPTMPQEHFTEKAKQAPVCGEKYASRSTMENPEDLDKSTEGLASYVRKNKMKY